MADDKPKTTKVRLLVSTRGAVRGDTIEVESAAAKQLVADQQAVTLDAVKEKKSTANADRRKAAQRS